MPRKTTSPATGKSPSRAAKKSASAKPADQDLMPDPKKSKAAKPAKAAAATKAPKAAKASSAKSAKAPSAAKPKKAAAAKAAKPKAAAKAAAKPKAAAKSPARRTTKKSRAAAAAGIAGLQPIAAVQGASATAGMGYSDIVTVESAKFEIEARPPYIEPSYAPSEGPLILPDSYGDTKITGLARDLRWAYAYWEIGDDTRARHGIPRGRHTRTIALRVYDVTGLAFDGVNAHLFFDIVVNDLATSWYFELPEANRTYCLDVGYYAEDGTFVTVARSNIFLTPRDVISDRAGDTWMEVNEQNFQELFRMSGGLQPPGGSSELLKRLHIELLEKHKAAVSSGAFSSGAVPRRPKGGFWFQVNAELIVYGATEPDAKVFFGGDRIPLQSDGTFTLRFSLPDGEQVIALKAVKHDDSEDRKATLLVTRKTK